MSGDLIKLALEGKFDIIMHGCNCFNTMGAGIALQIAREFPSAEKADKKTLKGDASKLGGYTFTRVVRNGRKLTVVNLYTQYHTGANFRLTAIAGALLKIKPKLKGLRVGIPRIGAGIGGGNWKSTEQSLDLLLPEIDLTVVDYEWMDFDTYEAQKQFYASIEK